MCWITSGFLSQRLKRSTSDDARDFNNIETWAVTKFLNLQGKTPKEILAILNETLGGHASSYSVVKKWVLRLIVVFFPAVLNHVLDDPNSDNPGDYW
jgi:hypothetical protein